MVIRKRLQISGRAMVFVTTTVREWTPVFANKECASSLLDQLGETLLKYQVSMVAFVLMPSHFHALFGMREIEQLSRVMQTFKSLSARRIRPLLSREMTAIFDRNGKYSFWKPRFDDLIIYSEKQFRIKTEYIHNNPVGAGLVEKPTDYAFSSAGDWLLGENGLIHIDKQWSWLDDKTP